MVSHCCWPLAASCWLNQQHLSLHLGGKPVTIEARQFF